MSRPKLTGVCWILIPVCNLKCPICYGYFGGSSKDVNTKLMIIDRLAEYKIKKLMFSGGDPTIDYHLPDLVCYAKSKGMKTALSTNGILLSQKLMDDLNPYLDELTLPIDGSIPEIHGKHRGSNNHFFLVMELLDQVNSYKFKTDVSTVITSVNRSDVLNIFSLVERLKIKKWKIFQYDNLMQDDDIYRKYYISASGFNEVIVLLNSQKSEIDIDFRKSSPEIMQSYVNISPSGEVLLVKNNRYQKIGSIFDNKDLNQILTDTGFSFDIHAARHFRD